MAQPMAVDIVRDVARILCVRGYIGPSYIAVQDREAVHDIVSSLAEENDRLRAQIEIQKSSLGKSIDNENRKAPVTLARQLRA